uniref:PDZ and LIM domain protein 2 n=1 Tax=Anser brachyrhynchus TaxID=132585 RepID=A0A8B9IA60_9AVES
MEQGKAAAGDLRPGDVIVSINGESAAEMLNVEAQNKIKQSPGQLRLQVERLPLPSPSHTNGDSSPDRLAARFQVRPKQSPHAVSPPPGRFQLSTSPLPSPGHREDAGGRLLETPALRPPARQPHLPQPEAGRWPGRAGARRPRVRMGDAGRIPSGSGPPLMAPCSPHSSQPLPSAPEELPRPGLPQEPGSLSHRNSSPGPPLLPPSPQPPSPPNLWETGREQRPSSPSPGPRNSPGPEPAMRRLEEDSEVYKMLQENRELRAAPRQSSTFRLLQEALEDEGGAGPAAPFPSRLSPSARKPVAGVQKLHTCEKCGSSIATQAVRIQEGRYRHPACYACSDCGLNLKMRGHFWVGDEMYCEKHARLRYQGTPGGPSAPPAPTPS